MKKYIVLLCLILASTGLFAKQYLYTINTNPKTLSTLMSLNLKNDLDKALFDLILRGFTIVEVIPTISDGYTIGYTILYEDNK